MLKVLVLVAAVALAQGSQVGFGSFSELPQTHDPRVLNGQRAELGQFPYQCSLHLKGPLASSHFCGCSILSNTAILTAGHCVTEVNIGLLQHVEVLAGIVSQTNQGSGVQISRVANTIVNPNFPGGVAPYDLAIHILETPLVFNDLVQPIALPASNSTPSGFATLSGWGSTSHTQIPTLPDILQWEDLPLLSYEECLASVEGDETPLEESMLCTGPLTGGYGACSGDSGGPLVQNGTLVGVVSWGFIPCGGAGNPSVFTKVSSHVNWIKENL